MHLPLPLVARRSLLETVPRGRIGFSTVNGAETHTYTGRVRPPPNSARSNEFHSWERRPQRQKRLSRKPITDVLEQFGLSEIPKQELPGVNVDDWGQLWITCKTSSRQKHKTALLLSRAAFSLVERDFTRAIGAGRHAKDLEVGAGLEQIIPLRRPTDLLRVEGCWILLFTSPAFAARCQSQLQRLCKAVGHNLPISFTSKVTPPPNYAMANGYTLNDYTLSAPWQSPSIWAHIAPFDRNVQQAIDLHNNLTSARELGFPVHVWTDRHSAARITVELLQRFLHSDGLSRYARWRLIDGDQSIMPLTGGFNHGILCQDEQGYGEQPIHNWCLVFQTSSEAKRFVRVWHRMPWPKKFFDPFHGPTPLLKAECLFGDDTL